MRSVILRWVPAAALSMVAACGGDREPSPAPPSPAPACANGEHCAYETKDSDRRTAAPGIGRNELLDAAAVEIHRSARDAGCVEPDVDSQGHCTGASELSATEEDAAAVRRSLAKGGYSDAVVRLGRDSDPTVPGALIYAVRVGDACVMGDVTPPPDEQWHEWYAGLLPGGHCLTP